MGKAGGINAYDIEYDSNSVEGSHKVFRVLAQILKKLDSFGVESRGIERIQPHERATNRTKQLISVIGLWLSACGGLSSMSSFFLGPLLFGLGLKKSMVSGLIASTIGCFIAAYCSLMGPRSGCRQMVGARFLFGPWAVKFVALVSVVGVMGWSVVNSLVGGQILASVSNGKVPVTGGIVIMAGVSFFVATFGIKQVIRVEAFLAIPVNLSFLLLYICAASKYKYLSNDDIPALAENFTELRGAWLSFFSLCYSITSTWGSIASDYYILFPEDTPDIQVFLITLFGTFIPTTFVGVLALLLGNIAMNYQPWTDAYEEYGMGGLLATAYEPWSGGGKFLTMLLFMSLISNNIINTYSAAFGAQLAGRWCAKVPRWFWAIVATIVYLVCALVGRNKFSTILGNFLPMIGYWISMYFIILLEENQIFRTKRFIHLYTKEFEEAEVYSENEGMSSEPKTILEAKQRASTKKHHYNFNIWNDYSRLTHGFAATAAFLCGATGAAVGMAQAYWVGPIAKHLGGEEGGDIAMWLCMGFSGLVYPFFRYWELKKFGR